MSDFLYISIPTNKKEDIHCIFQKPVSLKDVTEDPIGSVMLGGKIEGKVFFVTDDGLYSNGLLYNPSKTFLDSLERMCKKYPAVSIIWHCYRGIAHQHFNILSKKKLNFVEFKEIFPKIEENVKYIIIN